jgi:NAD(P)H-hydrate repair Nnr-like enzyme with NAD(P)H-hydrate epimerase domain
MSLLSRSSALSALAIAVFAVVGCGGTVIDSSKIEDQLEAYVQKSQEKSVSSVDCPSGVDVKAGNTFDCTVDLGGGKEETVTVRILNSDADTEIANIKSGSGK